MNYKKKILIIFMKSQTIKQLLYGSFSANSERSQFSFKKKNEIGHIYLTYECSLDPNK